MNICQVKPSQYIKIIIELYKRNSRVVKSSGIVLESVFEKPNIKFIQERRKNVGPSKYKNINKNRASKGNRSKKKLKKSTSAIKNIEPGKPKNTNVFTKTTRNNLGVRKFNPDNSFINRVLNLRAIASTSKNEFVESNA